VTLALAFNAPVAPTLRPYQLAALEAIEARFAAGDRGTLLVLATGLGKTVCFAELARRRVTAGHRALVLAHRTELLEQARDKLLAIGVDAAIEQGPARAGRADVVVASVQTLRGPRLQSWSADAFDTVIIDEAHHATASTYVAIIDHFATAKILGVTATPDRADGAGLGPLFQSVAFRFEIAEGIREGYLAPIKARRIKLDVDLDKVKTRAGDFDQVGLAAAMTDPAVIEATSRALMDQVGDRPCVLFTVDVAHAHLLAEACNQLRPGSARAVSGESSKEDRAAAARDLAERRVQIVANAALWTEGFDCPVVACVAMAKPTKSRGLFAQCVGRGTRLAPGKTDCLVLDFAGLTTRHKLVSTVDVLAGVDVPPEIAELALERSDIEAVDLEAAIKEAREELARARRAPTFRWVAEEVGDLLGVELDGSLLQPGFAPATADQLAELTTLGFKPPPGLTDLMAARVLAVLSERKARGYCSAKQVKFLVTLGIPKEHARTFKWQEAGHAIPQLKPLLGGDRRRRLEAAEKVLAEVLAARTQGGRR
jgi:superfamily II DNA or RNA helicase